jgi:hypothetical protein
MRLSFVTGRAARWIAFLLLCLAVAACGDSPVPPAGDIITKSVAAMRDITSLHFLLDTNKLETYPKGLFLVHAEGDAAKPDKLRATAKALLLGSAIEVQVVGLGTEQYMTDPASGRWQRMPPSFNVLAAFDPSKGIADILANAKDPQNDGTESVDGVACYRVKTTLSPDALKALSTEVNATAPLPARLWISTADSRLVQVELSGPLMNGEPGNIVRTVKFSQFNAPVDIQKPTVGSAPRKA